MRSLGFWPKIWIFDQKYRFLTKNVYLWPKCRFLTRNVDHWPKMSLFDQKCGSLTQNVAFWPEMWIFDQKMSLFNQKCESLTKNVNFWPKMSIFIKNWILHKKFEFFIEISILVQKLEVLYIRFNVLEACF